MLMPTPKLVKQVFAKTDYRANYKLISSKPTTHQMIQFNVSSQPAAAVNHSFYILSFFSAHFVCDGSGKHFALCLDQKE